MLFFALALLAAITVVTVTALLVAAPAIRGGGAPSAPQLAESAAPESPPAAAGPAPFRIGKRTYVKHESHWFDQDGKMADIEAMIQLDREEKERAFAARKK